MQRGACVTTYAWIRVDSGGLPWIVRDAKQLFYRQLWTVVDAQNG